MFKKGRKQITKSAAKTRKNFRSKFGSKSTKCIQHHSTNRLRFYFSEIQPKGLQNGGEIDPQSHQKSMPKQVTNNIMKIIKTMFL